MYFPATITSELTLKSLSKLLALVLFILAGTAVTVDGYLESREPGKPRVQGAVLTSSHKTPELPTPPCGKHLCDRDETS